MIKKLLDNIKYYIRSRKNKICCKNKMSKIKITDGMIWFCKKCGRFDGLHRTGFYDLNVSCEYNEDELVSLKIKDKYND